MITLVNKARAIGGLFASHSVVTQASQTILDLVFPSVCHGCGRVDFQWCNVCLDDLHNIPISVKTFEPEILTGVCASGHHRGKLQQAIQAFKYHNTPSLAEHLGRRLVATINSQHWTYDMIIPVPLFAERLKERGYNQAELLSQQVEQAKLITCQPKFLTRHRETNHQVGLTAQARRDNVKDAFIASQEVANKSILLIDDVVTTGSTLDACATALFDAGAICVYAVTVSHA